MFLWILLKIYLINRKVPKFKEIIANLLNSLQDVSSVTMSIKLHFPYSHLDHCPRNLGDLNNHQGDQFHQGISEVEERSQETWDDA